MSRPLVRSATAVVAAAAVVVAGPAATAQGGTERKLDGPVLRAAGSFTAEVDFGSLQLRDLPGSTCRLTVNGVLSLTGTLDGTATGRTTAIVFAPCSDVATTPPGTYPDVFSFRGAFIGTVDGSPADGRLSYAGYTAVGGAIAGGMRLTGDASAALGVDASVAVGGRYAGLAKR